MSSPYPFSSPPQVSHFLGAGPPSILGRGNGAGKDHQTPALSSPIPSPYFSPYSSSFQSPTINSPFVGANSPHNFGHSMPINLPIQDSYYGGGTPAQSPQLYSPHPSMMDSPRMGFPTSPWSPTTSWASTMLPSGMGNSWLGLAGMGFPSQPRPKLTTTLWEDENTVCYQVDAKGICVARRQDNDMVNGTKLLNVTGMSRGKRDGILKNEKGRVVVKVGAMHLKGVWITFQRAKALAAQFKIADLLYPLFADDPSPYLYNPHCPPNMGGPQMSNVSGVHSYMNGMGSPGLPQKSQMPYHNAMAHLAMSSPNMYASQGHPRMGSSPSMNSNLLSSPPQLGSEENENTNSVHDSPIIQNHSYSRDIHNPFVSPAEPGTREYEISGNLQSNPKKRNLEDMEDGYYGNLGRTMSNPLSRGFAAFPSPLSLSPSSLPSPSIAQSNSTFNCDASPLMNKRIKLPDSEQFRPQESNDQEEYLNSLHGDYISYERPTSTPAFQQESLGLLFDTLSPPESETDNQYEPSYDSNRYEDNSTDNGQRYNIANTVQ
ncbi:hypothetical protein K7432_005716 [Basidiobolus ranarum]|uniref:HTH APSES-type domain-containing protein n=1 Tax=Basidiobolus ranarum TaxID=34480 RepID=A0ABR2WW82_9FUNG